MFRSFVVCLHLLSLALAVYTTQSSGVPVRILLGFRLPYLHSSLQVQSRTLPR